MACGIAVAARGFFSSWLATTTATFVVILCAWAWFIQPLLTLSPDWPPERACVACLTFGNGVRIPHRLNVRRFLPPAP
jgi:hypothetical protein